MFKDTRRLITIFITYCRFGVSAETLERLGPIFIKFGQALSTRPDLIPSDLAESLTQLQDKVTPFSTKIAIATIESSLKKPIHELFNDFEEEPIGSASIAQVHGATLHSGERVVVKVLRPNIEAIVARDIRLLYTLSRWATRWVPGLNVLKLHDMVAELDSTLTNELDLVRECANGSVLKRNLADMLNVKIPKIYWDYTTTRVATMERIHGICIGDKDALIAQGIDLPALAESGVKLFFTQVFHHRYFHADMHPGNVFINTENWLDPQFVLVDFGIMGTLSAFDQTYLAQNLLAFIHRDYRRVAELHIESGWVPKTVRVDAFEAAIRTVCEPMFERPIKDISFGKLLMRLFQTAQQFEMRIQPQLLLLQKTILNVEGITRHLYPELNVWETARPVIESWMKERMGPKAAFKSIKKELPYWIAAFPDMPEKFMKALEALAATKGSQDS